MVRPLSRPRDQSSQLTVLFAHLPLAAGLLSTPLLLIDSGHATLASAYSLFSEHHPSASTIRFDSRFSGTLYARRARSSTASASDVGLISLDFPTASILALSEGHRRLPKILAAVEAATGLSADQVVRCAWFDAYDSPVVELVSSVDLRTLEVKASALASAGKLVILTQPSPEQGFDIASRVFAAPLGGRRGPRHGRRAHCAGTLLARERGRGARAPAAGQDGGDAARSAGE